MMTSIHPAHGMDDVTSDDSFAHGVLGDTLAESSAHHSDIAALADDGHSHGDAYVGEEPLAASQYDISHHGEVVGTPEHDIECWHLQHSDDTCAIASQEFVLDELGLNVSEEALVHMAEARGVYSPGYGTPMYQTGSLLESFGVPVVRENNSTFSELVQRLSQGDKIIVGVDAHKIWHDQDSGPLDGSVLSNGAANHAVQVIGVEDPNGSNPMVILNDPGSPDGRGMMVSETDFLNGWNASGNFLVAVPHGSVHSPKLQDVGEFPAIQSVRTQGALGSWEQGAYSGAWYERAPDGSYTGNWSR